MKRLLLVSLISLVYLSLLASLSWGKDSQFYTVVIDPGHGGEDPGAIGERGLLEKDVVLDIAKHLKEYIDAADGVGAVLTREDDNFIPLNERVRIAEKEHGALFVSIHCNDIPRGGSKRACGVEVFYPSIRFSTTDAISKSRLLAEFVLAEFKRMWHFRRHNRGMKQANFVVLRSKRMPSVLVEVAFLSNPYEVRLLGSERFRKRVARSLSRAITRYFDERDKVYIVQSGDTLSGIARKFGLKLEDLVRINRIRDPSLIRPGQKLTIP